MIMLYFFYFTCTLALVQASDLSQRLIGGNPAEVTSHPYHAYLLPDIAQSVDESYCSGVLISASYILTTQYCIEKANFISVRLGVHSVAATEEWEQVFNVAKESVSLHYGYVNNALGYNNDLALIKLPVPAKLSKYVQLVALPKYSEISTSFENEIATFEGFGVTDTEPTGSDILQTANLQVISNLNCEQYHGNIITTKNLCTNGTRDDGEPVGVCNGDRGGPLVIKRKLIGIGSYVLRSCIKKEPSIFIRVSKYLDWISSITGIKIQMY